MATLDITSVRKWDEQQVQRFLCSHMNGRYKHLASSFKMVDGLQVYNLTESQMKDICGKALGSALYQNLHPESKRNGNRPYYGDDAGDYTSLRNDSELEDQLNFYSRSTLPPLLTSPSIPTIIALLTVALLLVYLFLSPLKGFSLRRHSATHLYQVRANGTRHTSASF